MSTMVTTAPGLVSRGGTAPRARTPRRVTSGKQGMAASGARMRLTRRGRAVLAGIALAAVLCAGSVAGQALAQPSEPTAYEIVAVTSGQTLWGIASDLAEARGDRDVRDVVLELQRINGLTSGSLQAGQSLRVPIVP